MKTSLCALVPLIFSSLKLQPADSFTGPKRFAQKLALKCQNEPMPDWNLEEQFNPNDPDLKQGTLSPSDF